MTVPSERMRALRWGGELLAEMQQHCALSFEFRERIAQVMLTYPEPSALTDLVQSDLAVMPTAWADAIESAGRLLEEVQISGQGSEDLKYKLRSTLRHYPHCSFKQLWCVNAQGFSIQNWLFLESS